MRRFHQLILSVVSSGEGGGDDGVEVRGPPLGSSLRLVSSSHLVLRSALRAVLASRVVPCRAVLRFALRSRHACRVVAAPIPWAAGAAPFHLACRSQYNAVPIPCHAIPCRAVEREEDETRTRRRTRKQAGERDEMRTRRPHETDKRDEERDGRNGTRRVSVPF